MRRILTLTALAIAVLMVPGCIEHGNGNRETWNFSRTMVVNDAVYTSYRSRLQLEQVTRGSEGTVTVYFINDTNTCVQPYWTLRLVIGAVDRTVSGVSTAGIAPGHSGQVGSFSFEPRIDLARIGYEVDFWYLRC